MKLTEHSAIWAPIAYPRPRALWSSVAEIIEAYQRAEPVRVRVSQRYSLVAVEPVETPDGGEQA